jgi:hypothetical protein
VVEYDKREMEERKWTRRMGSEQERQGSLYCCIAALAGTPFCEEKKMTC